MGKVKVKKIGDLIPKKKCCRKEVRCLRCPFVVIRMKRLQENGASKKKLKKELKKIRAA